MKRNPSMIEYILPDEKAQEDEDFIEFYSQFNLMLTPVAFVLSYYRNRSWKWAAVHTLLAAPYVAYVLVDVLAREEAREVIKLQEDLKKKARTTAEKGMKTATEQIPEPAWNNSWDYYDE